MHKKLTVGVIAMNNKGEVSKSIPNYESDNNDACLTRSLFHSCLHTTLNKSENFQRVLSVDYNYQKYSHTTLSSLFIPLFLYSCVIIPFALIFLLALSQTVVLESSN